MPTRQHVSLFDGHPPALPRLQCGPVGWGRFPRSPPSSNILCNHRRQLHEGAVCDLVPVWTHVVIARPQLADHAGRDARFFQDLPHRRRDGILVRLHRPGRHLDARHSQRATEMTEHQDDVVLHYITDDLLDNHGRRLSNVGCGRREAVAAATLVDAQQERRVAKVVSGVTRPANKSQTRHPPLGYQRLSERSAGDRSDGLDLDQLILVAQHSDAQQRAGNVVIAERVVNDIPHHAEVRSLRRCHQHSGADDISQRCTGRSQRFRQILKARGSLTRVISHGSGHPVRVERTRTREEHQAGPALHNRAVRIRCIAELGRSDQTDGRRHPSIISHPLLATRSKSGRRPTSASATAAEPGAPPGERMIRPLRYRARSGR